MEQIFHNLVIGFGVAATPINLLFALIGCLLGTLIGVLPGIGPVATIAMLLPITFNLSPVGALIMLAGIDRKSTRLNSSHPSISYAVFCLKKKKNNKTHSYHYAHYTS